MSVVREVEAVETSGLAFGALARKYGIKSADTVQTWVRNYGNGSRGKVIRMEKPEAIEQGKKLKERVRERTAGSLPVELALERAYTNIACERAGIEDVSAFKKSGWVAGHQGVATQGEQRVVSVSAVCPPLGMSRQNDDARRRVREAQAVEAGLVTELVRAERRLQPRLGGRKLRVVK
jgi:transposase-like protein